MDDNELQTFDPTTGVVDQIVNITAAGAIARSEGE